VGSRDYDEFMAIVIIGAIALVLANLVLDIVYSLIDPRISLGSD
jgi:peptide/nickel transport system permease protein